jgi:GAF domain-containing protein
MTDNSTDRLSIDIAVKELAAVVLADFSMTTVLERAAGLVKRTIPGADEVSITMQQTRPATVAATGPLALDADQAQYDAGYGPCLDALRLGQTVVVADQTTDPRWPSYAPQAVAAGILSSLAVPLPVDDKHVGVFNIYSKSVGAFDDENITTAEDLANYAALVLNNATLYFNANALAEQMAEAMRTRAVIEQAKGILMAGRRCDADAAFETLVKLSQDSGRKLNVVAQALVDRAAAGHDLPA